MTLASSLFAVHAADVTAYLLLAVDDAATAAVDAAAATYVATGAASTTPRCRSYCSWPTDEYLAAS